MKILLQTLAAIALGLIVVPCGLLLRQQIELPAFKQCLLASTIIWFGAVVALDRLKRRAF